MCSFEEILKPFGTVPDSMFILFKIMNGAPRGTDGVSTDGFTAFSNMFFDGGTFWVRPLTYFYLPNSARAYLFPQPVKNKYFCSAPLVLTSFVRHQGYIPICYMYIYTYIHMYVYVSLSLYIYMHICIYIYVYVYVYVDVCVCVYTYIHIYVYVYLSLYIYIYIYIYIHQGAQSDSDADAIDTLMAKLPALKFAFVSFLVWL